MANNDSTDVLMTFIGTAGGVEAECSSIWDRTETLMKDFETGKVFEIDDFSVGGGLEAEESSEKKNGSSGENGLSRTEKKDDKDKKSSRGNKFANYVQAGTLNYPIDLQDISISRQMDKASPTFMDACLFLKPFVKAVIVKRKVGHDGLKAYLRMEFKEPLITSVEWEDGEIVKEKLKFVCRGLDVTYYPQKPDGSMDAGKKSNMSWKPHRRTTGSGN